MLQKKICNVCIFNYNESILLVGLNEQNYCTLEFLHEMQKYTKIKECNVSCVNLCGLGLHLGEGPLSA